jgi:hypothetical protein
MVTGAAAILKGARPFLSSSDIKQLLINTCTDRCVPAVVVGHVLPDQLARSPVSVVAKSAWIARCSRR